MTKPKLPKAAIEDFAEACRLIGEIKNKPSAQVLKHYLQLMDKHSDYFFDTAWKENYDYPAATTITQTDHAFLACPKEEFEDRWELMLIKKNLYLNGFMTMGMLIWTPQAYEALG